MSFIIGMRDNFSLAIPDNSVQMDLHKRINHVLKMYCEDSTKFKKYNYSPEIYDLFTRRKENDLSPNKNDESYSKELKLPNINNRNNTNSNSNDEKIVVMKFYNKQSDEGIANLLKGLKKTDKKINIRKLVLKNDRLETKENEKKVTNKINLSPIGPKRVIKLNLETSPNNSRLITETNRGRKNIVQENKTKNKLIMDYNLLVKKLLNKSKGL